MKSLTCWKGNFIHSHTQELTESLVQDSNDNNKDNVKKSHFIHSDIEELAKSLIEFSIRVRRFNLKKTTTSIWK